MNSKIREAAAIVAKAILWAISSRMNASLVFGVVLIVVVILSSPWARWWAGLVILCGAAVAVILHLSNRRAAPDLGLEPTAARHSTSYAEATPAAEPRKRVQLDRRQLSTGGGSMLWTKRYFSTADGAAVYVRDLAAAQRWYAEKLGLPFTTTEIGEDEGDLAIGYAKDELLIYLVQSTGQEDSENPPARPPMMFANKLAAAHQFLVSRGVAVEPIQSDSGGNQFFHFRDLDGNTLEVCQET